MEFGGILTGVGFRARQPQDHRAIEQRAAFIAQRTHHGTSRQRQTSAQSSQYRGTIWSADPQHRDGGTARARGERENRGGGHPGVHSYRRTTGSGSATVSFAPVAARISSTVIPGAISRN